MPMTTRRLFLTALSAASFAAKAATPRPDRKSTRLNSSHLGISYAVFCLKKKNIDRVRVPFPGNERRDWRAADICSEADVAVDHINQCSRSGWDACTRTMCRCPNSEVRML